MCFLLLLFYRKTCTMQQNIVKFKHMLLLMNYLSFVSLDTIEVLFFFLHPIFVTAVRLMNYELYDFIRIVRIKRWCFPWGLLLGYIINHILQSIVKAELRMLVYLTCTRVGNRLSFSLSWVKHVLVKWLDKQWHLKIASYLDLGHWPEESPGKLWSVLNKSKSHYSRVLFLVLFMDFKPRGVV